MLKVHLELVDEVMKLLKWEMVRQHLEARQGHVHILTIKIVRASKSVYCNYVLHSVGDPGEGSRCCSYSLIDLQELH